MTNADIHYLCETFKSNPIKTRRGLMSLIIPGARAKERRESTIPLSALNALAIVSAQNTARKRVDSLSPGAKAEIFDTVAPCMAGSDKMCLGASIFIVDMLKDKRAAAYVAPYVNDKRKPIRQMARRTLAHYGIGVKDDAAL